MLAITAVYLAQRKHCKFSIKLNSFSHQQRENNTTTQQHSCFFLFLSHLFFTAEFGFLPGVDGSDNGRLSRASAIVISLHCFTKQDGDKQHKQQTAVFSFSQLSTYIHFNQSNAIPQTPVMSTDQQKHSGRVEMQSKDLVNDIKIKHNKQSKTQC